MLQLKLLFCLGIKIDKKKKKNKPLLLSKEKKNEEKNSLRQIHRFKTSENM